MHKPKKLGNYSFVYLFIVVSIVIPIVIYAQSNPGERTSTNQNGSNGLSGSEGVNSGSSGNTSGYNAGNNNYGSNSSGSNTTSGGTTQHSSGATGGYGGSTGTGNTGGTGSGNGGGGGYQGGGPTSGPPNSGGGTSNRNGPTGGSGNQNQSGAKNPNNYTSGGGGSIDIGKIVNDFSNGLKNFFNSAFNGFKTPPAPTTDAGRINSQYAQPAKKTTTDAGRINGQYAQPAADSPFSQYFSNPLQNVPQSYVPTLGVNENFVGLPAGTFTPDVPLTENQLKRVTQVVTAEVGIIKDPLAIQEAAEVIKQRALSTGKTIDQVLDAPKQFQAITNGSAAQVPTTGEDFEKVQNIVQNVFNGTVQQQGMDAFGNSYTHFASVPGTNAQVQTKVTTKQTALNNQQMKADPNSTTIYGNGYQTTFGIQQDAKFQKNFTSPQTITNAFNSLGNVAPQNVINSGLTGVNDFSTPASNANKSALADSGGLGSINNNGSYTGPGSVSAGGGIVSRTNIALNDTTNQNAPYEPGDIGQPQAPAANNSTGLLSLEDWKKQADVHVNGLIAAHNQDTSAQVSAEAGFAPGGSVAPQTQPTTETPTSNNGFAGSPEIGASKVQVNSAPTVVQQKSLSRSDYGLGAAQPTPAGVVQQTPSLTETANSILNAGKYVGSAVLQGITTVGDFIANGVTDTGVTSAPPINGFAGRPTTPVSSNTFNIPTPQAPTTDNGFTGSPEIGVSRVAVNAPAQAPTPPADNQTADKNIQMEPQYDARTTLQKAMVPDPAYDQAFHPTQAGADALAKMQADGQARLNAVTGFVSTVADTVVSGVTTVASGVSTVAGGVGSFLADGASRWATLGQSVFSGITGAFSGNAVAQPQNTPSTDGTIAEKNAPTPTKTITDRLAGGDSLQNEQNQNVTVTSETPAQDATPPSINNGFAGRPTTPVSSNTFNTPTQHFLDLPPAIPTAQKNADNGFTGSPEIGASKVTINDTITSDATYRGFKPLKDSSGTQPTDDQGAARFAQLGREQEKTTAYNTNTQSNTQTTPTEVDLTSGVAPKYGLTQAQVDAGQIPKPTDARVPLNEMIRSNPNIAVKNDVDLLHVQKDTLGQVLKAVNYTDQKVTITAGYAASGHAANGAHPDQDVGAIDIKLSDTSQAATETFVKTLSALGAKNIGIYDEAGKLHLDNMPRGLSSTGNWSWGTGDTYNNLSGWRKDLADAHIAGEDAGYNGLSPNSPISPGGVQVADSSQGNTPGTGTQNPDTTVETPGTTAAPQQTTSLIGSLIPDSVKRVYTTYVAPKVAVVTTRAKKVWNNFSTWGPIARIATFFSGTGHAPPSGSQSGNQFQATSTSNH